MKKIQELLTTSTGTEGSLLIERKIFDTLIEAADKNLIGRGVAAWDIGPASIPGSSIDLDLDTADSMKVYRLGEGGAVPLDVLAHTSVNLRPSKFGVRIAITEEMIEDSKFALLEHNIRRAGIELAENLDALILTALDGAANAVTGGAAVTIANITAAMTNLEANDFTPTDYLIGPAVLGDLRNIDTFVEFQKVGTRELLETGSIGEIFGMQVRKFSANIGTTTTSYVLDRNHAFAIAEKRPITVRNYDDATHDLRGAVVTQRIVVTLIRSSAVSNITST